MTGTLHPDLEDFLALSAGVPRLHTMTLAQARAAYDAASVALDEAGVEGDAVVVSRDFALRPGLGARLYRAGAPGEVVSGQPGLLPVLLYFHGGGYVLGGLDSHDGLCRDLASRMDGVAVLAVDYRRAPEHRFPAAFEDAFAAYEWLRSEGQGLGLDATRVAVAGDSVGGTLAAALCLHLRDTAAPMPRLQALLYPCCGSHQDEPSHQRLAQGHLLERDTLQWMFAQTLSRPEDRLDWRFAPLRAASLAGVPPAWISLAEFDPLVDEGRAYAEALSAAGVPTALQIVPGMVHDFARLTAVVPEAAFGLRARLAEAVENALLTPLQAAVSTGPAAVAAREAPQSAAAAVG